MRRTNAVAERPAGRPRAWRGVRVTVAAMLVAGAAVAGVAGPAAADYSASCTLSAGAWQRETVYGVQMYTSRGMYMGRGGYCQIGKSRMVLQNDGNLVLYDEAGRARWAASWSQPRVMGRGAFLYMQNDNNFVLYDNNGAALWASDTYTGVYGGRVAVQADGNLVVYNASWVPLWASNSAH